MDMGSGSGVVSIFAAAGGAESTAVDINPAAVKAVMHNAEANGLNSRIKAVQSDLFKELSSSQKFDIIFFNPPYYKGTPQNDLEQAFKGGENLEVISRFLTDAKNFIMPSGEIYFIVSSDMDVNGLKTEIVNNSYNYQIIKEIKRFFETFYIIKLVVNFVA